MRCPRLSLWCCLVCLLVCGCRNRLTKENIGKVKLGMSEQEVFAILGKGKAIDRDTDFSFLHERLRGVGELIVRKPTPGTCYLWYGGKSVFAVRFVDGKLAEMSSSSFDGG